MSVDRNLASLVEHIEKGLAALDKLTRYYDEFVQNGAATRRSLPDAIVISDMLTKYYTCLETVYLRISQYFENELPAAHWHRELLEKMTLRIEDLREPAVSGEAFPLLLELMRFRHFRRYYFELDYDWDRLDFLMKKLAQARPLVLRDIGVFQQFIGRLRDARRPEQGSN